MLRLENISCRVGNSQILQDVSLSIATSTIVGIIGKSGAGKSSLLRCLNLMLRPTSGNVFYDDVNLCDLKDSDLNEMRQNIGVIGQNYALLNRRTVYENVALPLDIHQNPQNLTEDDVEALLDLVGVLEHKNKYPSELSGGQCQRVAIARAIIQKPKILLCDEFTSALDPKTTCDILNLLKTLNVQLGLTIVFVAHDMELVTQLAHRIVVVDDGCIVEHTSILDALFRPKHPITQHFMDTLFSIDLPKNIVLKHALDDADSQKSFDLVLKLKFEGNNTTRPIIADAMRDLGVSMNIIAGNLDFINDTPFGNLVISIDDIEKESDIMAFLNGANVIIEKMGYTQWN